MLNLKPKNKKKNLTKDVSLQNPKILEVNLVKDEAKKFFDWHKGFLALVIVLSLAALLVLEIYFGLDWWQSQEELQTKTISTKITELNAQIVNLRNKNSAALDYKVKSAAFSKLLNQHVYFSNFFAWLEKNTLSTVKYTGFQGDLSGEYKLQALAPNYADVSWQVKAFLNDPEVEKVSVLSASSVKSSDKTKAKQISFTILLKINPNIFIK